MELLLKMIGSVLGKYLMSYTALSFMIFVNGHKMGRSFFKKSKMR